MASTNTTRPTSDMTYLANRPSRRNPILPLPSFIQALVRHPLMGARICVIGRGPCRRKSAAFQPSPILAQIEGAGRPSASMVSPDCGQNAAVGGEGKQSAVEKLPQDLVHRLAVLL